MFVRAIALALCFGYVALPAFAVTPAPAPVEAAQVMTTQELMHATALDRIFDTYAETIADSPETQGTPLPAAFLAAWKETALEVFEADGLHAALALSFEGKLSEAEMAELATFFRSEFGRQVTDIEGAVAQLPAEEQLAAVAEGNAVLDGLAADATRVRQIDEMLALVSAEISRSMVGVAMRAMMVSMAMSGATGDIEVPWEEIDEQLAMILPGVELEVLASQRALMAYAYQDLSDDQLEVYVEFLRTDVSQKFYAIVGYGVGAIMESSMGRFGEQLARRLNQVNV